MKNPALSFPVERGPAWYHQPWPWLLMAGPIVVVAASLASAWLAMKSDDGVVAEDYYKRGLLINQQLKRSAASAEHNLGATLTVADSGQVRVRVDGLVDAPTGLRLRLAHPTRAARDQIVALTRSHDGDYVGLVSEQTPGRWIVILESDSWRLPTTTVAGRLTNVRLGAAAGHW